MAEARQTRAPHLHCPQAPIQQLHFVAKLSANASGQAG